MARIGEDRELAVRYIGSFAEAAEAASTHAKDGDMILTLGAGTVSQLGPMILEKIEEALRAGDATTASAAANPK